MRQLVNVIFIHVTFSKQFVRYIFTVQISRVATNTVLGTVNETHSCSFTDGRQS